MTNDKPSNFLTNSKYIIPKCRGSFKLDDKCKFLKLGIPAFKFSVKIQKERFFFCNFPTPSEALKLNPSHPPLS